MYMQHVHKSGAVYALPDLRVDERKFSSVLAFVAVPNTSFLLDFVARYRLALPFPLGFTHPSFFFFFSPLPVERWYRKSENMEHISFVMRSKLRLPTISFP